MKTATKEHPILVKGRLVRAILEGRKTQTRRVIRPEPFKPGEEWSSKTVTQAWNGGFVDVRCPFGNEGHQLWVRETWCRAVDPITSKLNGKAHYQADGQEVILDDGDGFSTTNKDGSLASPWKPSIQMPRWASRIQLLVTGIRIQRIREISEEDAFAEGIPVDARKEAMTPGGFVRADWPQWTFHQLWDSSNKKRGFGWDANPWVWVVEFKRVVE